MNERVGSATLLLVGALLAAPVPAASGRELQADLVVPTHELILPGRPGEMSREEAERRFADLRPTPASADERIRYGVPVEIRWPDGFAGTPLAMATVDLDLDGRADLVTTFATADGGALTVAAGTGGGLRTTPLWFEAMSTPIGVPVAPDLLAIGDFDADGRADVVVAGRGSDSLFFLAGDGARGFAPLRERTLAAPVTALAAGELFRRDGRSDLVVATSGRDGAELVLYRGAEGGIGGEPVHIPLDAPAEQLLSAIVDPDRGPELLIAAAGRVARLGGDALCGGRVALRARLAESAALGIRVSTLGVGRFGTDPARREVGALLADGRVARLAATDGSTAGAGRGAGLRLVDPGFSDRRFADDERSSSAADSGPALRRGGTTARRALPRARFSAAQVASGSGEELLLVDPVDGSVEIRFPAGGGSVRLDLGAEVLLPYSPYVAGRASLLVAGEGRTVVVPATVNNTFTVNTLADTSDTFPADSQCLDVSGNCSLRAAIQEANALGGPDAVVFDAALGAGTPTITLGTAGLPAVIDTLEIHGTTAGGPTRIEINANGLGVFVLPFVAGSDGSIVESLVVNRTGLCGTTNCGIGLYFSSANNVVRNCRIGPSAAGDGSVVTLKGDEIWLSGAGATGNLIGGTTPADRNLLSNGNIHAIRIEGAPLNTVVGNWIGVDAAGTSRLRNYAYGVIAMSGATGTVVGGSTVTPGTGPGNVISGSDRGVAIYQVNNTLVQGNLIGTNAAGTASIPGNPNGGVDVSSSTGTTIGGATTPLRNVISGNDRCAIFATNNGGALSNLTISGNYIGTDVTGAVADGNGTVSGDRGIWVYSVSGASTVTAIEIGGATATPGTPPGNVIAANGKAGSGGGGIWILNPQVSGVTVSGNLIGTNAAGTAAMINPVLAAVTIQRSSSNTIGGSTVQRRNVLCGPAGIEVTAASFAGQANANVIHGNYIGTNPAGTASLYSGANSGIFVGALATNTQIGGTASAPGVPPGNVVSGWGNNGIFVNESGTNGNVIAGNAIGTNASGTAAIANSQGGVYLLQTNGNTVGGAAAGAGNLISGNNGNGVMISSGSNNTVAGNFIGLQANGTSALANTSSGVYVTTPTGFIAANNVVSGNTIGRNTQHGVFLNGPGTSGTQVRGNFIGKTAAGASIPNSQFGVYVSGTAHDNAIGGTNGLSTSACAGDCNIIGNNNQTGVGIIGNGAVNNLVVGNSLGAGGQQTSQIDLGGDFPDSNDAGDGDDGPNHRQNAPVVSGAPSWDGVQAVVSGTLNTTPSTTGFSIDVYSSATRVTPNWRTAPQWVGRIANVSTDGSGNAPWSLTVPFPLGYVTAAVTDSAGNTSELAPNVGVDADNDFVPDALDCAPNNGNAWSLPSATGTLTLANHPTTTFTWSAPGTLGAASITYDLLRSDSASDFSAAVYVAANQSPTTKTDTGEVPVSIYYYLVRAKNACGNGP